MKIAGIQELRDYELNHSSIPEFIITTATLMEIILFYR